MNMKKGTPLCGIVLGTALVLIGDFLHGDFERSRLYDPAFSTGFRRGKDSP